MKVAPFWSYEAMKADAIPCVLPNLVFSGPGFYLSDKETVLIVPHVLTTTRNPWTPRNNPNTLYEIYLWDCPFRQSLFHYVGSVMPPVRQDIQTKGGERHPVTNFTGRK